MGSSPEEHGGAGWRRHLQEGRPLPAVLGHAQLSLQAATAASSPGRRLRLLWLSLWVALQGAPH